MLYQLTRMSMTYLVVMYRVISWKLELSQISTGGFKASMRIKCKYLKLQQCGGGVVMYPYNVQCFSISGSWVWWETRNRGEISATFDKWAADACSSLDDFYSSRYSEKRHKGAFGSSLIKKHTQRFISLLQRLTLSSFSSSLFCYLYLSITCGQYTDYTS